jgi:hypothetical protein
MTKSAIPMEANARRVFSALQRPEYSFHKVSEQRYEIRSTVCVIQLTFDRYDASNCVVLLSDPRISSRASEGMSLWVLRHLRGLRPTTDGLDRFAAYGRLLAESFADLLRGDFSSVAAYAAFERRIFDHASRVEKLPTTHPTRQKFDNFDIRWLDDVGDAPGESKL